MERLDRVFANENWLQIFPNATITHLPKTYLDHNSILVKLNYVNQNSARPFRLENIWCTHQDFINIAMANWQNEDLIVNTKNFTNHLQMWGKSTFGNIFRNKKRFLAPLYSL